MSLILEALRKSEAERQLGRAPGLLTPMAGVPRRRGWLLPALTLPPLLLLVAAAGWWFGRGAPVETAPAHRPPTLAEVIEHGEASGADPATAPSDVASTAAERFDAAPAVVVPVTPAERSQPAAATASTPVATSTPAEIPAAGTPPPAPLPATTALPAQATPAESSVDADTGEANGPAAAAFAAPLEVLPTLPMLEPSLRNGLPPLRMSMHVYADPVDQRFVLIDGRRYVEGQAIDPRLQIAEIRRDGVVLSIDGQRFLLPRS
jgi:general secretion pathway protein B